MGNAVRGPSGNPTKEILIYNMFYGVFMAYIANYQDKAGTLVATHDTLVGKHIRTAPYSVSGGIKVYAEKSGYFLVGKDRGGGKDIFADVKKMWYEAGTQIAVGAPGQNYTYIFVKAL